MYHWLFDPPLAEAHQRAVDLIASGSSVLDIACGTGQFCFAAREQKQCRVVGIDVSVRMLDFARKTNPFRNVTFIRQDATDLGALKEHSFDYATLLMVMHELSRAQQTRVLGEALRVARTGIIIDSVPSLPRNAEGIGIRIVEKTFGHSHNANFRAFLAAGGIRGVLQASGLAIRVTHSSVFCRDCREVVVVSA